MNNANSYPQQKIRGLKRKYEAIVKCGYNKNLVALEFHHINPKDKSFTLDVRNFSNTKIVKLEE